MGVFLVFAVPPYQGLDEPNHFYRAFTISQGALIATGEGRRTGGVVPTCLPTFVDFEFRRAEGPGPFHKSEFIRQPTACDGQRTKFVAFENTAYYSPVPYIPQALALAVGWRLTHFLPALFYFGRLATFVAYLALVFVALRLAPYGRSVIVLVGAFPMSLLVATTYSADAMTIALALLLVACILRAHHDPGSGWRLFALAAMVALALALSKSTYFVLSALLLLFPARLFSSRLASITTKGTTITLIMLGAGAWYLQVRGISLAPEFPTGAINPNAQIDSIIHHPLRYARFAGDMLFGQQIGYFTWETFVLQLGFFRSFVPGQPFPPPWMMVVVYCLLLQAYVRDAGTPQTRSVDAIAKASFPVALVILNAVLIFTAIYVAATPITPGSLVTLEGRYFLPLVSVPLISLSILKAVRPRQSSVIWIVPFVLLIYVGVVFKVQSLFY